MTFVSNADICQVANMAYLHEVNPHQTQLELGWVTDCIRAGTRPQYVTSQLHQLSLASIRGR